MKLEPLPLTSPPTDDEIAAAKVMADVVCSRLGERAAESLAAVEAVETAEEEATASSPAAS